MDRLARNLTDLRTLANELSKRQISIQFIKDSLTFTGEGSPMANLLLSMLGAIAEFERAWLLERQREEIVIAKAEGKYKGRKRTLNSTQAAELRKRIAGGTVSKAALARELGISRETLSTYLRNGH